MRHGYYEFQHRTKIMAGDLALEKIPAELKSMEVRHPMILSDRGLEQTGTLKIVLHALEEGGIRPQCIYTDIP